MELEKIFTLDKVAHVSENLSQLHINMSIEAVLCSSVDNDFIPARAFFSSERPDPIIILGTQYDQNIGYLHWNPRIRKIVSDYYAHFQRKLTLLGEGSDRSPKNKNLKDLYRFHPFGPFVGEKDYDVIFVDDGVLVEVLDNLNAQGIDRSESFLEQRRREFLAPGIIKAKRELKDRTMFVAMHLYHFAYDYHILKELEKEHIDYVFLAQKQLFPPENEEINMSPEELQKSYIQALANIATVDFVGNTCTHGCSHHRNL